MSVCVCRQSISTRHSTSDLATQHPECVGMQQTRRGQLQHHCLSMCAGEAAARIEQLLLGSITSPQEASRLCAVQWANRLFDFQHVPARYICTLAAGDVKLEIREEGQSGLKPPKPQPGPCLPVCLSVCLCLSIRPSVRPSVCPFICLLSICLSVCLYLMLSHTVSLACLASLV